MLTLTRCSQNAPTVQRLGAAGHGCSILDAQPRFPSFRVRVGKWLLKLCELELFSVTPPPPHPLWGVWEGLILPRGVV